MLRLTMISHTREETVLKVEGWMDGGSVVLLEEECTRWHLKTEWLVLDLQGVRFIDRAGIEWLQRWSGKGLMLRGGSSFIQTLMKTHRLDRDGSKK